MITPEDDGVLGQTVAKRTSGWSPLRRSHFVVTEVVVLFPVREGGGATYLNPAFPLIDLILKGQTVYWSTLGLYIVFYQCTTPPFFFIICIFL